MYRRRRRRYRRRNSAMLFILPVALLIVAMAFLSLNGGILSYRKGKKAMNNENYKKAVECLQKATKKQSGNKKYRVAYGMALVGDGQYENARKEFDKAFSNEKSDKADKINKQAYRGMGICYFFAKNYENSITAFDKALTIDELEYLNLDILKYKADSQVYLGKYKDAVHTYTMIIHEDKDNEDMYLKRANAEAENGDVEQAVADYDYVIKKDSKNFDAYLGAYALLMRKEQDEKADSYLKAALDVKPVTVNEKLKYAVAQYYYYGITDEAVESLRNLIKENEPEAYFYLAKISYAEEDYEKVFSYLNSYVSEKDAQHKAEAYEMLGRCAMLEENYEDALELFENGIKQGDVKWTRTLKKDKIAVYEHLSDFDKAYQAASEYLTDFPDDQEVIREIEFIKTRLSKK